MTDKGTSQKIPLNLPCGKDLNHLRIQLCEAIEEKTITPGGTLGN
jgi:hypothetical protein